MFSKPNSTRVFHLLRVALLLSFVSLALAHGDEDHSSGDHSTSTTSSSNAVSVNTPASAAKAESGHGHGDMMMMLPFLHTHIGSDTILFEMWVPRSVGATLGVAIGLFFIAMFERWIAVLRRVSEGYWARVQGGAYHKEGHKRMSNEGGVGSGDKERQAQEAMGMQAGIIGAMRNALKVPFMLKYDIARGALYALSSAFGFGFMLIVMTYNVWYILAITLGLGTGEVVFGRFAANAHLGDGH